MAVRVKICGITRPADARMAAAAGADLIGLNFWPNSRRAVSVLRAREIVAELPAGVGRVGIFVNASRQEVAEALAAVPLDLIQFHGDEPAADLRDWPCPVVRAVRLSSPNDASRALADFPEGFLLCEGQAAGGYGGAGVGFDWKLALAVPRDRLILAGGLGAGNVAAAVRLLRPWAVDVASGVEQAPGIKDPVLVREFIENAKAA